MQVPVHSPAAVLVESGSCGAEGEHVDCGCVTRRGGSNTLRCWHMLRTAYHAGSWRALRCSHAALQLPRGCYSTRETRSGKVRAANHPKTHAGAPRSAGHTWATPKLAQAARGHPHQADKCSVLQHTGKTVGARAARRPAPRHVRPGGACRRPQQPPLHFAATVGQQSRPEHTRTQLGDQQNSPWRTGAATP